MMLAKFRCLKCNHIWKSNPGPTQCPVCNHLYIKWLNYEEMRNERNNNLGKDKECY